MKVVQSNEEQVQLIAVDSDIVLDARYIFLFETGDDEKVYAISRHVLQQFPNCMFTCMVKNQLNTKKSTEGEFIIKERDLEMVDNIINFVQSNFINILLFS